MGVKMAGRVTARAYAKKDPHFCSSGPIILGKFSSSSNDCARQYPSHHRDTPATSKRAYNRRQHSILSYLRRWISEIWYGIIRRLKGIFNSHSRPDEKGPNTSGRDPLDSELENAFWREGKVCDQKVNIQKSWDHRYSGVGDNVNVYSLYTAQSVSKNHPDKFRRDSNSDFLESSQASENGHSKLRKKRSRENISARIDSSLSFDEEYDALYGTRVLPRPLRSHERISRHEIGNFPVKKDRVDGLSSPDSPNSECRKRSSMNLGGESRTLEGPVPDITEDRVQTVSFKNTNVWYSRSELNTALPPDQRETSRSRSRPSSRIPRLCSRVNKSSAKHR
ncbi:uncharacterized protein LOC105685945 [Athalia rosae]|uniref:uncharacterized protein LOC105685945 n=1 Tax=Athalia rosae TaxID=37344 RepID=UPI0020336AB1|nr:uncharacterized protein LOC105685945 [Athalia rosae]